MAVDAGNRALLGYYTVPRVGSNVAAANLLLDWQPLMWKEDQSKRRATQPTTTRRKREPHITSGMRV
jgi:hypothetical protein